MKKFKVVLLAVIAVISFTFAACGKKDEYTVTLMDGTEVIETLKVEKGTEYEAPEAPAKQGYNFVDWYKDAELTVPYETDILSADLTLYAKYTASQLVIRFNVNGGDELENLPVTYGGNYTLPTPTKTGYTFVEWTLDGETFPSTGTYDKTGAVRVSAVWEINTYTVSYKVNGEVKSTENVVYNETPKSKWNTATPGYEIEGYYTDAEFTTAYEDAKIVANTDIFVKEVPLSYNIVINEMGGNDVDAIATYNSAYTLTAPTRAGYNFVKFVKADGTEFPLTGTYTTIGETNLTAIWEIKTYTVTYVNGAQTLGTATVEHGKPASLWTGAPAGHSNLGVFVDEAMQTAYEGSAITSATTLYVKIAPNVYSIVVNEMGGNDVDTTVTYGSNYSITAPTRAGYDFVKLVKADGTEFPLTGTYTVAGDTNLTAIWAIKTYTVTYYVDGEVKSTETVEHGASVANKWNAPEAGYEVVGYYADEELTEEYVAAPVTGNANIYVKVAAKTFNIIVNQDGDEERDTTAVYGGTYTVAVPEREHYVFAGYTLNGEPFTALSGTYTWTSDIVLVATWQKDPDFFYTTIYFYDGTTEYRQYRKNVADGNAFSITDEAPTKAGYEFAGWKYENGNAYVDGTVINPNSTDPDVELYASWTANDYSITVELNGGKVNNETNYSVDVVFGGEYELLAPVKEGYTFKGYAYNGANFALTGDYVWAQDITVTATWEINTYTVTYYVDGDAKSTETVEHGSVATNKWSAPAAGYTVQGYYTDASMTTAYANAAITNDTAIYVKVIPATFTITVNEQGGNDVDTTAVYGSNYSIAEPVREGYNFTGFTLNGVLVEREGTYTWTTDINLVATWEIKTYTVTYYVDGVAKLTQTVNHGSVLDNMWNSPAAGYEVKGYYTDSTMTSAYSGAGITANTNVYVKVEASTFSIVINNGGDLGQTSINATFGQTYSITAPVRAGYEFLGYIITSGSNQGQAFALSGTYTYVEGIEITAQWKSLIEDSDINTDKTFFEVEGSNYFKEREVAGANNEFTYVFLTGYTYNFSSSIVSTTAASGALNIASTNKSFTALEVNGEFTINFNRDGIDYTRKAKIVESIGTFNAGANYASVWSGDVTASRQGVGFIDAKATQTMAVGSQNAFIPDVKITRQGGYEISLASANLIVEIYEGSSLIAGDKYALNADGSILFYGENFNGKTVTVKLTPKYAIASHNVRPLTFNITVNAGVNVYTDAELRAAWSNASVTTVNVLRNIEATMAEESLVRNASGNIVIGDAGRKLSVNTYNKGSVYTRIVNNPNEQFVLNGNFFTVDGAKLPYVENCGTDYFEENYVNNIGLSDRVWSVDGALNQYYVPNVQSAIFSYNNVKNGVIGNGGHATAKCTINDLYITGNNTEDSSMTKYYRGDNTKQLLVMGGSLHGIIGRGGILTTENVAIRNTNIAMFAGVGRVRDGVTFNLNKTSIDNSWANSIYMFGFGRINISNSELLSGASAIISVDDLSANDSGYNNPTDIIPITIDANTRLENYVIGTEAWFTAWGMADLALQMKGGLEANVSGATSNTMTVLKKDANGNETMNFILLCRSNGGDVSDWNNDYHKQPLINVNNKTFEVMQGGSLNFNTNTQMFMGFDTSSFGMVGMNYMMGYVELTPKA